MDDVSKKCSLCQEKKFSFEFNKCVANKFGLHNHCRLCQKIIKRNWYLKNKESQNEKSLIYSKTEKGRESKAKTYNRNYQTILERNRIRRHGEKAKIKARIQRNKWYKIIQNRMACTLRCRIRIALKKSKYENQAIQIDSTRNLLGCSIKEFEKHLESKFIEGMSWENYGYRGWHVDHIIPCDSFDLTLPEAQKQCFHYSNMQPLWWKINLSKGNKIALL